MLVLSILKKSRSSGPWASAAASELQAGYVGGLGVVRCAVGTSLLV